MAGSYKIRVKSGDIEIDLEGDKKFVMDNFTQINKIFKGSKMNLKLDKPGRKKKRGRKPGRSKKVPPKPKIVTLDLKSMTLDEIIEKTDPKKEQDKILIFSYWINKHQKKREFRSNDIKDMFVEIKMDQPKNIQYHLNSLTKKKGYLKPGRKNGRFKISEEGIKYLSVHEEK